VSRALSLLLSHRRLCDSGWNNGICVWCEYGVQHSEDHRAPKRHRGEKHRLNVKNVQWEKFSYGKKETSILQVKKRKENEKKMLTLMMTKMRLRWRQRRWRGMTQREL
jgi:hypothetical protein